MIIFTNYVKLGLNIRNSVTNQCTYWFDYNRYI